jgi:TRAP-type C4-dicarboxylate transport system substrate-binding protein
LENPLAGIFFAKMHEVGKFLSSTNHMWDGFWFLANRKAWERLPADLREIVAKHINAAAIAERADIAALNVEVQKQLEGKGLVFNQPNVDAFRDRLRASGFYGEWKAKYGDEAWTLLERASGRLV